MPGTGKGRKPGNYAWYEIQDTIDYHAEFEKPKIVYPDIAKECEFTLDEQGFFGGNTVYFLATDELYLLGVLNSRVIEFFHTHLSTTIQRDYLRFFTSYMEQLPIPSPTPAQREAIEALVSKLLAAHAKPPAGSEPAGGSAAEGQGPQVEAWERELNELVYQVYGLEDEEIAIIEGT
jgi:hypothetical protein